MSRPRLVIFDPFSGGHHADHIVWLTEAWRNRNLVGDLVLAIAPGTLENRPDLQSLAGPAPGGRIDIDVLAGVEPLESSVTLAASMRCHQKLLAGVLKRHNPEMLMVMYLDHAQAAIASGRRRGQTKISGLLFRPELHLARDSGIRAFLKRRRKRWLLQAMAASPNFDTLFTLDPTAVPSLRAALPNVRVRSVPDPAHIENDLIPRDAVRAAYGIEPRRVLFVLPGALDERKGVFITLQALADLPESVSRNLAIVLAGVPAKDSRPLLESALERARASSSAQIIFDDRFLPGAELQSAIAAADVVLAPYQSHVGSSGIVMRAAAAERPVIAQAEGLIGWQVRQHRLGLTVPSGRSDLLGVALVQAVEGVVSGLRDGTCGFDVVSAAAFAAEHTVEAYTEAILDELIA